MATITSGGAAQNALAVRPNRRGYAIQNLSTGDLWFRDGATAAASEPSFRLIAGAYYETPAHLVHTDYVSIFGATTGQAFAVREW